MKFFVDNCLSPRLAEALDILDHQNRIVHLRDKFSPDIKDPQWISKLAREGDWIIISGDIRITKTPQNRKAWLQLGLTAFFFVGGWAQQTGWDKLWRAIRWWPHIVQYAGRRRKGSGWKVPINFSTKSGKFKPVTISGK